MKFYELAVGGVFTFRGQTFRKTAMSMAEDERRWGNVFLGETEIISDGPPLPPEVAAHWEPERGQWARLIEEMLREAEVNKTGVTSSQSDGHNQSNASPNQS
jgi:hypothetical protein